MLNPMSGLNFDQEEAILGKVYTVSEARWSEHAKDWYYQLRGLYSSYQPDWLMRAPIGNKRGW